MCPIFKNQRTSKKFKTKQVREEGVKLSYSLTIIYNPPANSNQPGILTRSSMAFVSDPDRFSSPEDADSPPLFAWLPPPPLLLTVFLTALPLASPRPEERSSPSSSWLDLQAAAALAAALAALAAAASMSKPTEMTFMAQIIMAPRTFQRKGTLLVILKH